jgi:integrase
MPRERKGSIRERRGGVFARVTFTDEAGNRREIERKAENRTHAKQLIKEVIRQLDEGVDILGGNSLTLDKYLDQWLEIAKSKLSNKTYSDYQQLLRLYVRPVIGKKALSSIKPLNIQSLYKGMQEKGLSPKTIRYVHTTLSVALKQAVRWQMISQNPCTAVELPKLQRKEMQSLSPEDATRFIEVARQDRHGLIFILALTTGMRPEEYLALQWKDIDFNRQGVTVHL